MGDRKGRAAERIQQSEVRRVGGGAEGREVDGRRFIGDVARASCLTHNKEKTSETPVCPTGKMPVLRQRRARQLSESFAVFGGGLLDDLDGQPGTRRSLVPIERLEIIADEL